MTFGERLSFYMSKAKVSQRELADRVNITPTRLNYWVKDKREPDVFYIKALSEALGVTGDELLGIESHNKPLSAEATEIALAFDSLSPEAKSLVRTVLDFATAHCITSPAPVTTSTAPVRSATPDPDIYPLKRIGTDAMTGLPFLGGIGGNDEILNIKNIASIERRELMEEMADEHCTTTEPTEPD